MGLRNNYECSGVTRKRLMGLVSLADMERKRRKDEDEIENPPESSGGRGRSSFEHKLPIEMVEKIFSMMPFPTVLNVKRLSKYWYGRFRSPQFLLTAAKDANWPVYGPLVVSGQAMMGFHKASGTWVPFSLPKHVRYEFFPEFRCITIEGSVLCKVEKAEGVHETPFIHVVDLITGVSKQLPWQLGYMLRMEPDQLRVLREGAGSFRIFMLFHTSYDQCKHYQDVTTVLYDARTGGRTVRFQCVQASYMFHNSAFFQGKLYCLGTDHTRKRRQIWSYDLDDHKGWWAKAAWAKIHDGKVEQSSQRIIGGGIFNCGSKLVVLTILSVAVSTSIFVEVHELEAVSRRVTEWTGACRRFDREFSQLDVPKLACGFDDCIYMSFSSNPLLEPCPVWALQVKSSMDLDATSAWQPILPIVGPPAGPRSYRTEFWLKFSFEPGRQLYLLPDSESTQEPVSRKVVYQ
ncbi:hypothetical protein MPTK2_3g10910 [Marchantia polymorpha subsp. ruderalis]